MNGAEAFFVTLERAGIDTCFANPGTTELAMVEALGTTSIRPYLVLHESVASGAADGFARMARRPAATLLHLGPGLVNAASNIHNARRAGSAMLNVVGDHASHHLAFDAPLTSDIAAAAAFTEGWYGHSSSAASIGELAAQAVEATRAGRVATAVLAADHQTASGSVGQPSDATVSPYEGDADRAADLLAAGGALFLGGLALSGSNLQRVAAIAAGTGCRVFSETFPARFDRGAGSPILERLPYFPEQAAAALEGIQSLVLVGARSPVAFFAYPDAPQSLVPHQTTVYELAGTSGDASRALELLVDRLGGPVELADLVRVSRPAGPITATNIGVAIAAVQPAGSIVVDESTTAGLQYFSASGGSRPFSHLSLTGGSLGYGLPAAVGAAIACPDRPVIAFQSDGAGMYSLQALWTMARYALNVTVVIASNRLNRILRIEAWRAGTSGPITEELTDLAGLDWVKLAEGHGVAARRVSDASDLADAVQAAVAEPGPTLIEAEMEM